MLSDQIIYDELKRQRESAWQPEALRLPLHIPRHHDTPEEHDEEAEESSSGVIIIDMNDGYSIVT
ncbi:hypothetical protein DL240_05880 [Lujinxingia litoralis]|uniref:Uncharacterized protein n=1 Tax=Lujinxingia litoralis TaxID=2211119 RepID=A0A328CC06_9DELT|nr:hypothetical protein [Lujinxingia litoralis]RAL23687.1 hypothetical protein DL240_05880 [Lujinxingia litoralis]